MLWKYRYLDRPSRFNTHRQNGPHLYPYIFISIKLTFFHHTTDIFFYIIFLKWWQWSLINNTKKFSFFSLLVLCYQQIPGWILNSAFHDLTAQNCPYHGRYLNDTMYSKMATEIFYQCQKCSTGVRNVFPVSDIFYQCQKCSTAVKNVF